MNHCAKLISVFEKLIYKKEPNRNQGSSCDLFVNNFKHQKGGLTVRALVVDVAWGWVPHLCRRSHRLTSRSLSQLFEQTILACGSTTFVALKKEKSAGFSHFTSWLPLYNSTKGIRSEECGVSCQSK